MSSPAIVARNQGNARHSTGPRTAAGKTIVARNPLRHGLLAVAPVVDGQEREQDWHRHRQAIWETLAPVAKPGITYASTAGGWRRP